MPDDEFVRQVRELAAWNDEKDAELHRIADELQAAQKRNFYQLHSTIRQQGRYCHEHSMAIEVERHSPTWQPPTDGAEDTVIEAVRDLARWLYRQLEREYTPGFADRLVVLRQAPDMAHSGDGRRKHPAFW